LAKKTPLYQKWGNKIRKKRQHKNRKKGVINLTKQHLWSGKASKSLSCSNCPKEQKLIFPRCVWPLEM
jgi:hypothetical protein